MRLVSKEERVGTTLVGKYRLGEILGHGGMGVVYAAEHVALRRKVAVKLLRPEHALDDATVTRFVREARATARLRHPNIVEVLDVDTTDDGVAFMVLELLEGETLDDHLARRGCLTPSEAIALLCPIADALATAHSAGIVHRDVKPSNILLHRGDDGRIAPKLLDFGVALVAEDDAVATAKGTIVGTAAYMSPEQALARRAEIGPWSDVWSLGVVAYRCLSGTLPFEGSLAHGGAGMLLSLATEPPVALAARRPELPPHVLHAVDRALHRAPNERFSAADAFGRALRGAIELPRLVAPPASTPLRAIPSRAPRPQPSRTRWPVALAAAALMLGALGLTFLAQAATPDAEVATVVHR